MGNNEVSQWYESIVIKNVKMKFESLKYVWLGLLSRNNKKI